MVAAFEDDVEKEKFAYADVRPFRNTDSFAASDSYTNLCGTQIRSISPRNTQHQHA